MRYGTDPNTFDWRLVSAQTRRPATVRRGHEEKAQQTTALAEGRAPNVQMATGGTRRLSRSRTISLQTITELARPGSSLIVSDGELPLNENGSGTEFVVLTR